MIKREGNRKVLGVFALCGLSVAAAGWIISEKFIASAQAAFWVNLATGGLIAVLFARVLEGQLNRSVDFLMGKIQRISKGDLTQRFKEDPDDILPYGLSYELGEAMGFLRGQIGNLWKIAALLSRQLEQFMAATQKGVDEVRREAAALAELSKSLDGVRSAEADLAKRISDLRVETASASAGLGQVSLLNGHLAGDAASHRERVGKISAGLTSVDGVAGRLEGSLADFLKFTRQMDGLGKSLQDITTGSSLVALNATIDASRGESGNGHYGKIVEEIHALVGALNEVSHKSGLTAGEAETKVRQLARELGAGRESVKLGLVEVLKAQETMDRSAAESGDARERSERLHAHLKQLHTLVEDMDQRTADFGLVLKAATGRFDKLLSDAQITVLKFESLEEKARGLSQSLRRLEEFKNLFEIA